MDRIWRSRGLAVLAVAGVALAGCGGGGGGSSTPAPTPSNPGTPNPTPGSLSLSPTTLNFVAGGISTPPPQTVTATLSGDFSGTLYIRIVTSGQAIANVSSVTITGPTTGQAQVFAPNASTLGPGAYTGTITVTACTSNPDCTSGVIGTPQTVNVNYAVNGLQFTPSSLAFEISDSSTDADYVKQLQVRAYPSFTASETFAAFSVTPSSSGPNPGTVTVTLDRTYASSLMSGRINTLLNLSDGINTQTLFVPLDIKRPQLNFAWPYVQLASTPGKTILRGVYMDLTTVTGIRFRKAFIGPGGTTIPATSFAYVSPTEILVDHPAMQPDAYQVLFETAQGVSERTQAVITFADTFVAPAAAIAYPDGRARRISDLIFDEANEALVLGVQYPGDDVASELLRFEYTGSWSAPVVRAQPRLQAVAQKADRNGFIVTSQITNGTQNAITNCSPTFVSCADNLVTPATMYRLTGMAATNTGNFVVIQESIPAGSASLGRWDHLSGTMSGMNTPTYFGANLGGSRDGSRVVIANNDGTGSHPLLLLNVSTDVITSSPFNADAKRVQLDGKGTRILVDKTRIYDSAFTLLGTLPATTLSAILSYDGESAFTVDSSDGRLHMFDLTATVNGGAYLESGASVALAGDPGTASNGDDIRMALSSDDKTLFIAGSSKVIVQPLP